VTGKAATAGRGRGFGGGRGEGQLQCDKYGEEAAAV